MACKLMSSVIIVFDNFKVGLHAIRSICGSIVIQDITAITALRLVFIGRTNSKMTYTVLLPLIKKVALMPCWCNDFAKSYEYWDGPSSKVRAKTPALLQWSYRATKVLLTAVIGAAETKQPRANAAKGNKRECIIVWVVLYICVVCLCWRKWSREIILVFIFSMICIFIKSATVLWVLFPYFSIPKANCYGKAPHCCMLFDEFWSSKPCYQSET